MPVEDTLKTLLEHLIKKSQPSGNSFAPYDEENESFDVYLQRFEVYAELEVLNVDDADVKKLKAKIFVNKLNTKTFQLLSNLMAPKKPANQPFDDLVKALQEHLDPTPSEIISQDKFAMHMQNNNEKVSEYAAQLQHMAQPCNFVCPHLSKSTADVHLRTQFIRGVKDTEVVYIIPDPGPHLFSLDFQSNLSCIHLLNNQ